jgi:putative membrane protein
MASADLRLDVNTELAARRTGMAFQRTRMAADRTLMAVMRTSLALISFGFTIFQFFERLRDQSILSGDGGSARRFGVALVALGIAIHIQYMFELRQLRHSMREERLVHAETIFPVSLTLITAFLLLAIGVAAIVSMEFRVGPFG